MHGIEISFADFGAGAFVEELAVLHEDNEHPMIVSADNQQQQQLDAHDDDYYDEDYDDDDDDNDYNEGLAVHMHGTEISVADFGSGAFVEELAVLHDDNEHPYLPADFLAQNLFLFLSDVGAGNVASLNLLQALRDFDLTNTTFFLPAVSVPDRFIPQFKLWMDDVKTLEELAARVDDSLAELLNEFAVATCCACASPPFDHDVPDLLAVGPASVELKKSAAGISCEACHATQANRLGVFPRSLAGHVAANANRCAPAAFWSEVLAGP